MNEPTQAPFAFMPATPKNERQTGKVPELAAPYGQGEDPYAGAAKEIKKRTRRTKAELAAAQGEKQIDPFDAFDKVYALLDALPKPVRDRIMSTLKRIYS